jgi:beta-glucosidase
VVSYDEGVFVGYRGWERAGTTPLYAFGHGLGYTTWQYDSLQVAGGYAEVTVTNTGARAGREIVQLYVGPAEADADRPARWLAGFSPVEAHPQESVTVRIPIPQRTFQIWDGGWRTVPGGYRVTAAHALDDPRLTTEITV